MPRNFRPVVVHVAALLGYLVITIALTWPFAARLDTAVSDMGDPLLNIWILDWVSYAIAHGMFGELFNAPMFFPARYPLAFSENLIGIALVTLPFHVAGVDAVTLYNIAMLLGFVGAGYGAFVLARLVCGSVMAAFVAGVLYAFTPFRLDHVSHLQVVWSGWLPLILAATIHFWRKPSVARAMLLTVAVVMNGLTNIHWLLFGGVAAAIGGVLAGVFAPTRSVRAWLLWIASGALACAILLPMLLPYRVVSEQYRMKRERGEVEWYSGTWSDWLVATPRNVAYGHLAPREQRQHERQFFPGLLTLFLTASGLMLWRRDDDAPIDPSPRRRPPRALLHALDATTVVLGAWAYIGAVSATASSDLPVMLALVAIAARSMLRLPDAWVRDGRETLRDVVDHSRFPLGFWIAFAWIVIGVLGSLGLHAFFHEFLYRFSPFQALRVPARWAMVAYTGLAATTALGIVALVRARRPAIRNAMYVLLLALAIHEVRPRIRWEHIVPPSVPLYAWMATSGVAGPFLELPVADGGPSFFYLLGSTKHRVPIANGTSGFEPPHHARLRELTAQAPYPPELMRVIEQTGCRFVVLHADYLEQHNSAAMREWLGRELAAGTLRFVRRFEHRRRGDWLFAVASRAPEWQSLRDPQPRDAAGFTPDENLARMLRDEPTYNATTFGSLESPRVLEDLDRVLTVSGWALSPHGIRSVEVLLHSGTRRFTATPYERPDVHRSFPWYPHVDKPGFHLVLPKRPRGVSKETDLQIEIVDGRGERTRLPDIPIDW